MSTLSTFTKTDGIYRADGPFGGEAGAFRATIRRDSGSGQWYAHLTTYGLPLDAGYFGTLNAARAWVRASYDLTAG